MRKLNDTAKFTYLNMLFRLSRKVKFLNNSVQVISHQLIPGEQGKKSCETLLAPFKRHDSEFSGGVQIEKTDVESLNLPCLKSTYYESLSVRQNKRYHELENNGFLFYIT